MIEIAIFGSIALLALAFMIQIGLRQNFQQEIEQDAFRRALRVAQNEGDAESQAIQYNYFRNRRIPNPADDFAITPRTLTQAGATVTWGEWLTYLADDRDSQPRIIVNLDDQSAPEFRSEDFASDKPLISKIQKQVDGASQIQQSNTSSSLNAGSTESTTLTLSNDSTVSSSIDTNIHRNW